MHLSSQAPLPKQKPASPQRRWLRSGPLECIYDNGFLRYMSAGNTELIRSIYPAVRDQYWQTAPVVIQEETVEQDTAGFKISYLAEYSFNDIRYAARVSISCVEGKRIQVIFSGTAGSNFLRNRIGLCALLPSEQAQGNFCIVGHPDGSSENIAFPRFIHPVQPFTNIRTLNWKTTGAVAVRLECTGDVFEIEDQRNWGDASYKLYSTPHHLPLPAAVLAGDLVQQEINIDFDFPDSFVRDISNTYNPVIFQTGKTSVPFPGIGLGANAEAHMPDAECVKMLRRLTIDHYRIELFLETNWKPVWKAAFNLAVQLGATIHAALYIGEGNKAGLIDDFIKEATKERTGLLSCVMIFSGYGPLASPENSGEFAAQLMKGLPGVRTGSGTDSFFAHWNQQAVIPENPGAFVSIPVNPQVHQPDSMTMVENLPAMADIVDTARFHSAAAGIFLAPVTLNTRYNPDSDKIRGEARYPYPADPRQKNIFGAAWTAAAIRYSCRADKLTFFEINGDRGLMPAASTEPGPAGNSVFPVYIVLREIMAFKPKRILLSRSARPLEVDGLMLENTTGERLMIFCNFSAIRQTVQLKSESWKIQPLFTKIISPDNVNDLLQDGDKFRLAPYHSLELNEGNSFRLPAGSIVFATTVQEWTFN